MKPRILVVIVVVSLIGIAFLCLKAWDIISGGNGIDYESAVITMERPWSSRNWNPVYKVKIKGSGEVTFEGGGNVSAKSAVEYGIDPDLVMELVDEFYAVDFLNINYCYPDDFCTYFLDYPVVVITFDIDDEHKEVIYNFDNPHEYTNSEDVTFIRPEELVRLETRIDEIANTAALIDFGTDNPVPDDIDYENAEITLERTACFGPCPVYTVTVYGSGQVIYEGDRYVGVTGEAEFEVDQASVRELVDAFYAMRFFDLEDDYNDIFGMRLTDMPNYYISISVDGQYKRIHDYYGSPPGLRDLEDFIDEVANTAQWVESEEPIPYP